MQIQSLTKRRFLQFTTSFSLKNNYHFNSSAIIVNNIKNMNYFENSFFVLTPVLQFSLPNSTRIDVQQNLFIYTNMLP